MSNQESQPSDITLLSTMSVEDGSKIAEPVAPTAGEGWTFVGWSSDSNVYTPFDFTLPITANTSIYAFFTSISEITDDNTLPTGTAVTYATALGGYVFGAKSESTETVPSELEIPSYINGIPVIAIAENAFEGNSDITSVSIPSSIKVVGVAAFKDATNIVRVTIDAEEIDSSAFKGTTSLANITIGPNVKIISREAFYLSSSQSDSSANATLTFGKNSQLEEIQDSAFENRPLTGNLIFPDTLTEIGSYVFKNTELTSVTFGSNIEETGSNAFRNVSTLTSITFEGDGPAEISPNSFRGTGLTSVTIPAGTTSIKAYAFEGTQLISLQFEEAETRITIYGDAFQNTKLTDVTIRRPVNLMPWIFEGVTGLTLHLATDDIEFGTDNLNNDFLYRFGTENYIDFMEIEEPPTVSYQVEGGLSFEHYAVPEGQNWPEDWDIIGSGSDAYRFPAENISWKK